MQCLAFEKPLSFEQSVTFEPLQEHHDRYYDAAAAATIELHESGCVHHHQQRCGVQPSSNGCALRHCRWHRHVWFPGRQETHEGQEGEE
eukprot:4125-Heterococcus_DN1.PRE.9